MDPERTGQPLTSAAAIRRIDWAAEHASRATRLLLAQTTNSHTVAPLHRALVGSRKRCIARPDAGFRRTSDPVLSRPCPKSALRPVCVLDFLPGSLAGWSPTGSLVSHSSGRPISSTFRLPFAFPSPSPRHLITSLASPPRDLQTQLFRTHRAVGPASHPIVCFGFLPAPGFPFLSSPRPPPRHPALDRAARHQTHTTPHRTTPHHTTHPSSN